jgi:thioredoxin 1
VFFCSDSPDCKRIEPDVKKISKDFAGILKVVSVDVGSCPQTTGKFKIFEMGVPQLFLFQSGKVVRKFRTPDCIRRYALDNIKDFLEQSKTPPKIKSVFDDDFAPEVLQTSGLVAVLFVLGGCCPYSRAMKQVMNQVYDEYSDRLKFVIADVCGCSGMAAEYGLQSVPQLYLFRNGQVLELIIGARPKEEISEKIETALEQSSSHPG